MVYFLKPIYIDKNEGIGSIISRLENTPEKNVALVFPPDSFVFKNVLEIEYLKREAEKLKKDIVIITPDKGQEQLARSFGFKVKSDLFEKEQQEEFLEEFYNNEKQKEEDKKEKLKITIKESQPQESKHQAQAEKEPKQSKKISFGLNLENFLKFFKKSSLLARNFSSGYIYVVLFISFIIFIYFISSVVLSAEVIIKPAKEYVKLEDRVIFKKDASVDSEKKILPLEIFTLTKEKSLKFTSSGEKEFASKAKGTAIIYNYYSSQPQILVRRTRLLTKDGKLYRLTKRVVVPGYKKQGDKIIPGKVEVEIEADKPGEEYNIPPTSFTIPGFKGMPQYDKFEAKTEKPITGGKIGKSKYVTKQDLEKAKEELEKLIKNEALVSVKKNLPEEYGFLDKLDLKIVEESSSLKEGEPGESFTYTIKADIIIYGYKKSDLDEFLKNSLKEELKNNKIILEKETKIDFKDIVQKSEEEFEAFLDGNIVLSYKFDKEFLKDVLKGKSEKEVRSFKEGYPEIKTLEINIKPGLPFISSKLPKDKNKIKIVIDYDTNSAL